METVIPRPFDEFDLEDHRRLDPVTPFHFGSGQPLVPTTSALCRHVKEGTVSEARQNAKPGENLECETFDRNDSICGPVGVVEIPGQPWADEHIYLMTRPLKTA
jgi:hypothetical protein